MILTKNRNRKKVKKILWLLMVCTTVTLAGCKKDATDDRIISVVIGKWYRVKSASQNECVSRSWRAYKVNGIYDEYEGCDAVLYENAGSWRVEDKFLIIKSNAFPLDVYYSFYYLSDTYMTIKQGLVTSDNTMYSYRKE